MKRSLLILLCLFVATSLYAKHIVGGEVIYEYLGAGGTPNSKNYRITVRLFRDAQNCNEGCASLPPTIPIGIFISDTHEPLKPVFQVSQTAFIAQLPVISRPQCLSNEPMFQYEEADYVFDVDLPDNKSGYDISYQTCCRVNGITNGGSNEGATYTSQIPGLDILPNGTLDNSSRFQTGISIICYNKPFVLDFSARDVDAGDSLVYFFANAYNGGEATNTSFTAIAPPPYASIRYASLFSGDEPLGRLATINSVTGIISGIAPDVGKYVVSVSVVSYRRGVRINAHRKDFIVTVAPCDFAGAQLNSNYTSCDGFTLNFSNLNSSPLNISFFWDFGDGQSSTDADPVHTYGDTGVYTMKLVVNRGSSCADSTTSLVRVFPGYFPDFSSTAPTCKGVPVQFNDRTRANYGFTNVWRWDFGLSNLSSDTSTLMNPTFVYPMAGTYNVVLIVSSNKGCIDTFPKQINIVDKAPFSVTNDTLICSADKLQLKATVTNPGTVTWSPNYNISDINSFTPLVFPKVNTTYYVDFNDKFGCSATDSVVVKVVDFVTLAARNDTAICRTDSIVLKVASDALQYSWTPAATLSSASVQSPLAVPIADSTRYHVIGRIGSCTKEDDIVIRTAPYPPANAGKDTTICFGFNAPLNASGGSVYSWSPAFFLNSTSISNPVSQRPTTDISYIVTVTDNKGCPKPVKDTVLVRVTHIIADAGPRDTSVVLTQPLQLEATGGFNYQWTPPTWLSNPFIPDPVSLPLENITYTLKVSDAQGCFALDTINVHVYKTKPDLFVPSAFTPNGDVLNDVFKPIAAGIRSLESFRVYNRWGQLMYSTTQLGRGWDGRFSGNLQGTATYVWYAEATDYLGKKIFRKGSVVLIR